MTGTKATRSKGRAHPQPARPVGDRPLHGNLRDRGGDGFGPDDCARDLSSVVIAPTRRPKRNIPTLGMAPAKGI